MIEIKTLPNSEIEIIGEISADVFEGFRGQAIKEASIGVEIKGFRPGNIPENILIEALGEPAILEKTALVAIQTAYPKIITEHKIKAIGRSEVNITKLAKNNPLGFKIKVSVLPEVELPDYKKIASEVPKVETKAPILPEGQNRESSISQPNQDDLGEIEKKEKRRMEILSKIVDAAKMDIPKVIIESEKMGMLDELKGGLAQSGLKWEDYLTHLKKTEEEMLKDMEKDAIKRAKYNLVLNEIADKEKVEVPQEELEKETAKILDMYKGQKLDVTRVRVYTYGIMRNQKVFELLEKC